MDDILGTYSVDLGLCCGVVFVGEAAEDLRSVNPLGWEWDNGRVIQRLQRIQPLALIRTLAAPLRPNTTIQEAVGQN